MSRRRGSTMPRSDARTHTPRPRPAPPAPANSPVMAAATEARKLHPTVLREYDIRGVVGETLTADDARAIARGFASIVAAKGGKRISVGRDGRMSSPEFEQAVTEGIAAAGLEAVRIGLGPTPMLYFSVYELGTDAGIMVSGSHNPP